MEMYKRTWESHIHVLTEAVDDITSIDDFLAVSGMCLIFQLVYLLLNLCKQNNTIIGLMQCQEHFVDGLSINSYLLIVADITSVVYTRTMNFMSYNFYNLKLYTALKRTFYYREINRFEFQSFLEFSNKSGFSLLSTFVCLGFPKLHFQINVCSLKSE